MFIFVGVGVFFFSSVCLCMHASTETTVGGVFVRMCERLHVFECVGVFDPIVLQWSVTGCAAVILSGSEVN